MPSLKATISRLRTAPEVLAFRFRRLVTARRHIRGEGLEIGALHAPLRLPRRARVRYVDRMDVEGLRRHYPDLPVDRLVPVEIVDDGETLASQPDCSADFIVANHFIEHTEDPIRTISNHLRVLRPGGVLFMGVPDRTRTFDRRRPGTSLEHLLADHREGPGRSRRGHLEEWAGLVDGVPPAEVQERVAVLERDNYSIHFHAWTADEFRAMLEHLRTQMAMPFTIEEIVQNEHEFIVVLRRS